MAILSRLNGDRSRRVTGHLAQPGTSPPVLHYAIQDAENDRALRRWLFDLHGIEPDASIAPVRRRDAPFGGSDVLAVIEQLIRARRTHLGLD